MPKWDSVVGVELKVTCLLSRSLSGRLIPFHRESTERTVRAIVDFLHSLGTLSHSLFGRLILFIAEVNATGSKKPNISFSESPGYHDTFCILGDDGVKIYVPNVGLECPAFRVVSMPSTFFFSVYPCR